MIRHVVGVAGRQLELLLDGEGSPPLVLLHGAAGRAREWGRVMNALPGRRRLAFDLPCHGADSGGAVPTSREDVVRVVVEALDEHAGAPLVLVGQSLGGVVALLVAAARPDLVARLVLIEATPDPAPGAPEQVAAWLERWPVPFKTPADALAWFMEVEGASRGAALALLDTLDQAEDGLRPGVVADDVKRLVALLVEDGSTEAWERLACPTLLIGGERSWLPKTGLVRMARDRPAVRLEVLPGLGHDVHLDDPVATARLIAAWLEAPAGS